MEPRRALGAVGAHDVMPPGAMGTMGRFGGESGRALQKWSGKGLSPCRLGDAGDDDGAVPGHVGHGG